MSVYGAIIAGLGSMFSSRRARKDAQKGNAEARRIEEMRLAQERRNLEYQRQMDLEDRRYRQEAIGGYRGMGTPGLTSPEYSSTTPSPVGVPQGIDPRDRPADNQQGLMYFR